MTKRLLIILILISLFIALFLHLDYPYLRGEEQRRAVVAIECMESGNYIVPTLLGETYYNKPPMFNWVVAGLMQITGSVSEWVVRLPGVLSLILISLLLYYIIARFAGKETGLLSALFFITSADIFFFASVYSGEIDLFYSLLVFIQIISLYWFYQKKAYLWMFLVSYLFCAFGLLTKGFPSLAFQGFTVLALLIYYKRWKLLFGWQHISGILLFVLIVVFYFFLYSKYEDVGAYVGNLFKESSQRSANEYGFADILISIFTFPLQLLKLILPWAVLIVFAFGRNRWRMVRTNKLFIFILIFLIPNILVYWISPELRNRYLYMFLPFVLVLIAAFYVNYREKASLLNLWLERIFGVVILILALFFVAYLFIEPLHAGLDYIWLRGIMFALLFAFLLFFYIRSRDLRIYVFILALILARIGHDLCVLPYLNANYRSAGYVEQVNNIIEITKDSPVDYYGKLTHRNSDVSFFSIPIDTVSFMQAPWIPYQIPYYLKTKTDHTMKFSEMIEPGKYYLSKYENARHIKPKTVYLDYEVILTDMRLVLFRVE